MQFQIRGFHSSNRYLQEEFEMKRLCCKTQYQDGLCQDVYTLVAY